MLSCTRQHVCGCVCLRKVRHVSQPVSDSDPDEDEDPLDAHWRRIQSRWTALEPQVVDVVSEWQRKLLVSGLPGHRKRPGTESHVDYGVRCSIRLACPPRNS